MVVSQENTGSNPVHPAIYEVIIGVAVHETRTPLQVGDMQVRLLLTPPSFKVQHGHVAQLW